jgi:hypothetical protein
METEGHAQEEEPLGFCKILGLQRKWLTGLRLPVFVGSQQCDVEVTELLRALQAELLRRQLPGVDGFPCLDHSIVVAVTPHQPPASHSQTPCDHTISTPSHHQIGGFNCDIQCNINLPLIPRIRCPERGVGPFYSPGGALQLKPQLRHALQSLYFRRFHYFLMLLLHRISIQSKSIN